MVLVWVWSAVLLVLPRPGQGYGGGAPTTACTTQMPGHGPAAQSSPGPFTLKVIPSVLSVQASPTTRWTGLWSPPGRRSRWSWPARSSEDSARLSRGSS